MSLFLLKIIKIKLNLFTKYRASEIMNDKMVKIWLHFKPLYIFTKQYQMEKKYVHNGILAYGDKILKEKELQHENKSIQNDYLNEDNDDDDDGNGIKKPQIFIDQLLNMREHFKLSEIKDELNTIIITVRKNNQFGHCSNY